MKKILNSICLFLFNRVAFPKEYKHKPEPLDYSIRGLLHRDVDKTSIDTRRFKNYLS